LLNRKIKALFSGMVGIEFFLIKALYFIFLINGAFYYGPFDQRHFILFGTDLYHNMIETYFILSSFFKIFLIIS